MRGQPTGTPTNRLGLTTIVTGSLPSALRTPAAPRRYTVEAIFSRKPLPAETAALTGDEGRGLLAERHYGQVRLAVADRRLVISETSLEQLRDGLAAALGELLERISDAVAVELEGELVRLREAGRAEQARQAEVAEIVETISFAALPRRIGPLPQGSSYR